MVFFDFIILINQYNFAVQWIEIFLCSNICLMLLQFSGYQRRCVKYSYGACFPIAIRWKFDSRKTFAYESSCEASTSNVEHCRRNLDTTFSIVRIIKVSLICKVVFHLPMKLRWEVLVILSNRRCRVSTVMDFSSERIAEQMTLLDLELFQKIEVCFFLIKDPHVMCDKNYVLFHLCLVNANFSLQIPEVLQWAKEQSEELSPHLTAFTDHFNKMSFWTRTMILKIDKPQEREKLLNKFIRIMRVRQLPNFSLIHLF